jgi:hypothetical protein
MLGTITNKLLTLTLHFVNQLAAWSLKKVQLL